MPSLNMSFSHSDERTHDIHASTTEIKRGIKSYFHTVCLDLTFFTTHRANSKQIWGNGSQALMLSDRL